MTYKAFVFLICACLLASALFSLYFTLGHFRLREQNISANPQIMSAPGGIRLSQSSGAGGTVALAIPALRRSSLIPPPPPMPIIGADASTEVK